MTLAFPLLLFLIVAGPNRHEELDGIGFPLYYMVGMASWGTMAAVIAGGARIAAERQIGWNRQLRVTPLTTRSYLLTKVLTGYLMGLLSIVLLYAAGIAMGVHLSLAHWAEMTLMLLIGLVPFAALGILLGHLLTTDSMGPAMGGLTSLFGLIGDRRFRYDGDADAGGHDLLDRLGAADLQRAGRLDAMRGECLRHHLAGAGARLADDHYFIL